MAGRISRLANPGFAKAVGEAYADGTSRAEMAEAFGAHVDTITDWCRDPRVQAHAARFAQERVNAITKITDREILNRLKDADDEDKMPTELLLKIRKEFLDRMLKIDLGAGADQPETINEVIGNLEDNPELARQLQEWASGSKR
jgi:hypothetical protein